MAAKRSSRTAFTASEWKKIFKEFDSNGEAYGLPERVYGSAVFASFNVRKLGDVSKKTPESWQFLARICRRFDLIAVQETMPDLSGLNHLMKLMGPGYEVMVSDTTGTFPDDPGLDERMVFIYRSSVVERAHIVSDVTYDRTKVNNLVWDNRDRILEAYKAYEPKWAKYEKALALWKEGKRRRKPNRPNFDLDAFLSFIRQPYSAAFRLVGYPGTRPYEFVAINAHLMYGKPSERKKEFQALLEWIIRREQNMDTRSEVPGAVLLGDLNLDFDSPDSDLRSIEEFMTEGIEGLDVQGSGGRWTFSSRKSGEISVVFPFLSPHPATGKVLRTNARLNQTFDQIAVFYRTDRIPSYLRDRPMGAEPRGPDFGVVNFVNLFAKAVAGKAVSRMSAAEKKAFYRKFEHDVSDHMPIWLRVPLPDEIVDPTDS